MHFSTLAKRSSLLLFIVLIAFYCYGLGHLPLLGPDEPRYAQVAREMFLRGDLVTPTLGGRPWFEKPVLLYWMMMGSFKLFGVSEWSARLPSAISGLLTVAAVFYAGNRVVKTVEREMPNVRPSLGFWSVLVVATTIGIAVFARAASFDIVLTMTTTWLFAFYFSYSLEEYRGRGMRWALAGFYIFVGLALLAKGLLGIVLPFGVLCFFYLFQRRWPTRQTLLSLLWGLPLALLVAATWYAPVIFPAQWDPKLGIHVT